MSGDPAATAAIAGQGTALVSTGHLLALIGASAALLLLLRAAAWVGFRRAQCVAAGLQPGSLIVAAGCAAVLSALLAIAVLRAPGIVPLDAEASAFLAPYRVLWLLAVFLWLTTLGTGVASAGIVVTATGFLWADDQRARLILPLWVAFAGAQASVWIGKYAVGRARPVFLEGVAAAASPSFPSAHTTGAVATLGFVAYAVARDLPVRRSRFEVAFWTAVLVALIGFSRVFLGVHFATDVAGGVLIGGAWLLIGLALAERQGRSKGTPDRPGLPS